MPASPEGNPEAVKQAAKALMEAESPVLIVEGLGRTPGGSETLQALVDLVGAPVIEVGSAYNLPNSHPLNVTGANAELLKDTDLVVAAGVNNLEQVLTRAVASSSATAPEQPRGRAGYNRVFETAIPEGTKIIQIGLQDYGIKSWPSNYGRILPTDTAILGDEIQVLKQITKVCQDSMDAGSRTRATERIPKITKVHSDLYDRLHKEVKERLWDQTPTSTARLAAEIWEVIKDEDWVLVHGSLSGWERRLWDVSDESRWVAGGGGTGTGMGVAMGAALAFRGTDKVCVSIQNDGDLLYTAGSLYTLAHHDIPMLVVMFNNRSYYQDVGHQTAVSSNRERSVETVGIGVNLDGPSTDFATLAQSFGLAGIGPILDAADIGPALKKGLEIVKNERRTAVIDTIVQPR